MTHLLARRVWSRCVGVCLRLSYQLVSRRRGARKAVLILVLRQWVGTVRRDFIHLIPI